MDLADFLAAKLAQSNYRDMEAKTGVSRGSLENIIKRQNTQLPEIETFVKIANTYGKPLWEVLQMAGVNLSLPQTDDEVSRRLAALLKQVPNLKSVVERLQQRYATDPEYVRGMIIALEAGLSAGPAHP